MFLNNNFKGKYAALAIATTPILGIYMLIPGVNISTFLLSIALIINIGNIKLIQKRKIEIVYFVSIIIIGFISFISNSYFLWYNESTFYHNLLPIVICFGTIILVAPNLDIKLFFKSLTYIGIVVSIISIYQRAQLITTGSFSHISLFPSLEQVAELEFQYLRRPTSLFLEPAHISIYLLPIFYHVLSNRNYIISSIIAIGILCSGSTTGLLVLSFIVVFFFLSGDISNFRKTLLAVGVILLYIILNFYASDIFQSNIEKLSEVDQSSQRIGGGFIVLDRMPFELQIVGLGLNQMSNYMGNDFKNYANSFLFSIISYGYLGLISLLMYLIKLYSNGNTNKTYFFILIAILASDQILFGRHLIYLLSIVILCQTQKYNEYKNSLQKISK